MIKACFRLSLLLLLLILPFFFLSPNTMASDFGILWGQVVDNQQKSLKGVKITVSSKDQNFGESLQSDKSGFFQLCGLPSGFFSIRFEAKGYRTYIQEKIFFEPSETLYLKITLSTKEIEEIPSSKAHLPDYTNISFQTIIDESQIQHFPSGNTIWSLVENQDLSATSNRIDVGGLWSSIPALFSSKGGCSWTQTIYLLNGLDVTDPYWGGMPLFFPDLFSLRRTQLINAGLPPQALSPGAYFDLVTKEGTSEFHGGFSVFHIDRNMRSSNISPALEKEGIFESHTFNNLDDFHLHLSAPLIPDKLFFYTSWKASNLSRDLADYEREDRAYISSGLVNLKYKFPRSTLHFLWTGQIVHNPSYGAGRKIPFSATLNRKDLFNVFQMIWSSRIRESHSLKAGLSFSRGNIHSNFQEGISSQHGLEIFRNIPSGSAFLASRDDRSSFILFFKGTSFSTNSLKMHHLFQYGFESRYSFSSSKKQILDNVHLHFFNGKPLEIIKYNTPVHDQESCLQLNLFCQETLIFPSFLSIFCGFNLAFSRGWIPEQNSNLSLPDWNKNLSTDKNEINWLNLSPRLGLVFPLSKKKTSALKMSAARYYFTLPLNFLTYGNPGALGGIVYSWQDSNNDRQYQEGEARDLLRREGPFYSKIDPDLKRPSTDELTLSFVHTFGAGWTLTLAGFLRESRNLVETLNIGVPFASYKALEFFDIGDDRILDTHDDLTFTVYNQEAETLGQDFFLLTNADSKKRISRYRGLDLTLLKKSISSPSFFLSLTATEAIGTTSPGNTEWENDDGLVGSLYDNPNTLINAKGRMRFDRAYTGRIGLSFEASYGLQVATLIKYYDGQPFARKIIVEGLNQGPFYIQAHPRGVARYEYNMTVDIRLEKTLNLGSTKLRIILDGFNIFNRGLATEENEWTGPDFPLRFATEILSPRVFRLGLSYEF